MTVTTCSSHPSNRTFESLATPIRTKSLVVPHGSRINPITALYVLSCLEVWSLFGAPKHAISISIVAFSLSSSITSVIWSVGGEREPNHNHAYSVLNEKSPDSIEFLKSAWFSSPLMAIFSLRRALKALYLLLMSSLPPTNWVLTCGNWASGV